jgi:7-cyano-7-deazaguanine synthase
MSKSAVIVISGGMDSSVLAHYLKVQGYLLKAMTIDYGQKHASREIEAAIFQSQFLGIEHRVVDLKSLTPLFGESSLTNMETDIPSGHYTADSMKATVVPNRNMIILSVAAAFAISNKFDFVAYAAHAGDHTIYPDCRPEFAQALNSALELADWHKVSLLRPFVSFDKQYICKLGSELGIDFNKTWSCYRGAKKHCGHCGTCVERKEAFALAKVVDPTEYEDLD